MKHKSINDVYSQVKGVINETYNEIGNEILVPTQYGIVVYNKYVIRKIKTGVEIIVRTTSTSHQFGSAKNALIWAILDHHTKISESKRVKELDGFIYGVDVDRQVHTKLKDTGNTENFLIQSSKLQRDKERQNQFLIEIDKYNIIAQKCQQTRTIK
jgi:hypothetical protein